MVSLHLGLDCFHNQQHKFVSFLILYAMNSMIPKKVFNWDFILCLFASIQFYHYDHFFLNWWYLYILVYIVFISSSINLFIHSSINRGWSISSMMVTRNHISSYMSYNRFDAWNLRFPPYNTLVDKSAQFLLVTTYPVKESPITIDSQTVW